MKYFAALLALLILISCSKETDFSSNYYKPGGKGMELYEEIYRESEEKANLEKYKQDCLNIGFVNETEAMANCVLKMKEIDAISLTQKSEPVVVKEEANKANFKFCQKMPGAYTTTYHCW